MAKYIKLFMVALFATISFTFTSCEDNHDEPEDDPTEKEIDYTKKASGYINVRGDKNYSREIKDAGWIGYYDHNTQTADLHLVAYFSGDTSDSDRDKWIANNDRTIEEIRIFFLGVKNAHEDFSKLKRITEVKIYRIWKYNGTYVQDWKDADFEGEVTKLSYKDDYFTIKFSDCKITTSDMHSFIFNGEIKFAHRNIGFFN